MLFNGIQDLLGEAHEAACYVLCLLDVAEEATGKSVDVIDVIHKAIDDGIIYYNQDNLNDNNNFYVNDPARLLSLATGKTWKVRHDLASYTKQMDNEYVINRWERQKTGYTISHFDRDGFHPLERSLTIQYGHIVSTRVCTLVD